jgi:hypothetical protein
MTEFDPIEIEARRFVERQHQQKKREHLTTGLDPIDVDAQQTMGRWQGHLQGRMEGTDVGNQG